jgi:glycosyltransferase involved in cell wall biosynthesis
VKVLHAPVNIAGQPIMLVNELRRRGVQAALLEYGPGHVFGYETDRLIPLEGRHRLQAQVEALEQVLAEDWDIVHLWMATLFASSGTYHLTGRQDYAYLHAVDLPFLKVRGKRIVYSSTGFDIRREDLHATLVPENVFRHGYEPIVREKRHRPYVDYLRDYVDMFLVLDPELREFMPHARVLPRVIDLEEWDEVGISRTDKPLVVHAPSKSVWKGTRYVLQALDELRAEGVPFELELIEGMSQERAAESYRRADVVVDQLLIGWYGVFAVEAMALGKPVLAYVREDLFDAFTPPIPIATASPATVKDRLRELLTDQDLRLSLAARARPFVEELHDVRKVADRLLALYEEVLEQPPRTPQSPADLEWFLARYRDGERREEALSELLAGQAEDEHVRRERLAEHARRQAEQAASLKAELSELREGARKWKTQDRELTARLQKAKRVDDFDLQRDALEEKAALLPAAQVAAGGLADDSALMRDAANLHALEQERLRLRAQVEELRNGVR